MLILYLYSFSVNNNFFIGLDPAGPLFYTTLTKKLSSKVGIFVDVLHSNAFLQGSFLRLGHVDFFMNGGVIQPGCGNEIFSELIYFI